ncbi:MAG: glycosyltransferase family 2 protein [Chloroflexi bacterium]|nr:glycosyltransferase family 2 protein [Chloroflexota bacterium]
MPHNALFCSTIIATIGRPTLARAVESVLRQDFAQAGYEVIVVNDSGQSLAPAPWQQSEWVTILHTPRRERCVARNTGAAIARGQYLHFLDDDDWLLPGALATWWGLAQQHPQAGAVYGGAQLVDRQDRPIIRFQPRFNGNFFAQLMAGEWIIQGASAIQADLFFQVGGFPLEARYAQDTYLTRRIGLQADIFGSPNLVACFECGDDG